MVDSWATTLLVSNKFWEASATWRLQRLAGHPFCFNHERGPFIITISICKSSQSQVCSMLYPIRSPRTFLHIFSLFVPGMWTAEGTVRHMLLQKETPILPPDPARHLTLVVTSPRTPCDEGLRHWKMISAQNLENGQSNASVFGARIWCFGCLKSGFLLVQPYSTLVLERLTNQCRPSWVCPNMADSSKINRMVIIILKTRPANEPKCRSRQENI